MNPSFKTRRKVAVAACVVALVVLAFYTRCSDHRQGGPREVPAVAAAATRLSETASVMLEKEDGVGPRSSSEAGRDGGVTDEAMMQASLSDRGSIEYLLLLGLDRSKGHAGRTDAILILAFNHDTGHVGVISVPRDLYVDIPGLEPGRINTVVRLGDRKLGRGKGLALLKRIIRQEIGVEVSRTVTVDFEGFVRGIDALGGIDVEVKCPIEDCFKPEEEDAGCIPLSLAAGTHRLDGYTALLFARSRHGRTDSDRSRRQQAVLAGIRRRLMDPDVFPRLPALWIEMSRHVSTDLGAGDMLRMARFAVRARNGSVHGLVLRHPVVEERITADGKDVVQLNDKALRRALAGLFDAPPPGAKQAGVCPPPDVGLHWRERLRNRKQISSRPLVFHPSD